MCKKDLCRSSISTSASSTGFAPASKVPFSSVIWRSLVADAIDGAQTTGCTSRIERGKRRDAEGAQGNQEIVELLHTHRQAFDVVDLRVQPHTEVLQALHQRVADGDSGHGTDAADQHTFAHEQAEDAAIAGAHGLEDGDLLALLGDHQEERTNDAETRHQDGYREYEEGRNLLQLERAEQAAVHLLPVANRQLGTRDRLPDGAGYVGHFFDSLGADVDGGR